MAKRKVDEHLRHRHHMRRERMAYGVFISALGCLWLASEIGWIQTGLPIGPIIIIVLGFTLFLPWVKS